MQSLKIKKDSLNSNSPSRNENKHEDRKSNLENSGRKSNDKVNRGDHSLINPSRSLRRTNTRNYNDVVVLRSHEFKKNDSTRNIRKFGTMHNRRVRFKKSLNIFRESTAKDKEPEQEGDKVRDCNVLPSQGFQGEKSEGSSRGKMIFGSRSFSDSSHELSVCQNLVNNIFSNIQPNPSESLNSKLSLGVGDSRERKDPVD